MNTAAETQKQRAAHTHQQLCEPTDLLAILQTLLRVGGAVLVTTGLIASLCSLFLYHSATSWFKSETIAIYLLQIIAGFATVATSHYLHQHPISHNKSPKKEQDQAEKQPNQ